MRGILVGSPVSRGVLLPPHRAPTTVIEDAFTDTDDVLLTAHTIAPTNPLGLNWVNYSWGGNGLRIAGNRAQKGLSGNRMLNAVDVGNADVKIDMVAMFQPLNWAGQLLGVVRLSDTGAFWWIWLEYGFPMTLGIVEFANPTTTWRASVTTSFGSEWSRDFHIHIETSGPVITATLENTDTVSYGSATMNQGATKFGLAYEAGGVEYDNFKIVA